MMEVLLNEGENVRDRHETVSVKKSGLMSKIGSKDSLSRHDQKRTY